MATSKGQFEYTIVMKDINTPITNRDKIKIIKEATFANSTSKLQKEIKFRQEEFKCEPNAGHNATVNNFAFQPFYTTFKPKDLRDNFVFSDPIIDDRIEEEQGSERCQNLLNTIDIDLDGLLKKSIENTRSREMKNQTLQRPEYISIEEVKSENARLFGNLKGIEDQFSERRRKEKQLLENYLNLNDCVNNIFDGQCSTTEGIREIIQEEEKRTLMRSLMLRKFAMKEQAKRGVFRIGYTSHRPIDSNDEKFIKKYAKYILMKKIKDKVTGDEDDEYEREYETYLFNANSPDSPTSLSLNNEEVKQNKEKAQSSNKVANQISNLESINVVQSFVAFIKLIFAMIDKDQNGLVAKDNIENELRLDDKILQDLGFQNNEDFIRSLNNYNADNNELNEKDFIILLLSRSDMKDDLIGYLNRISSNDESPFMKKSRKSKGKEIENNEVELSDDEEGILPGFKTHVYDFLGMENEKMKLDKLNEIMKENETQKTQLIASLSKPKTKLKLAIPLIQLSYHEYLTFIRRFHFKDQISFTIPKPFEFLKRDYQLKKMTKMKEILEERVKTEDALIDYHFKAIKLKEDIWDNKLQNIIEYEMTQRKARQEKLKAKIVAEMKPFSFYDTDERKYREKLQQECRPPTFPKFRANAVRWMSQVNLYEDMISKQLEVRQQRVKERMEKTIKASKLPPRMQMHADEMKLGKHQPKAKSKPKTPKYKFKAGPVPDFLTLQDQFESKLEQMKKAAVPTEPIPFTFHEPKKKMELRNFLDNENDPEVRNPQLKIDIAGVVEKMQRKPKFEPLTTKSLNLLMEAKRRELEEKQRKEDEKILEDELRREKQDRLRERVQTSKAIIDNKKELVENRRRIQDDFRMNLQKKKESYDVELQRRLQKVYNKPLMIEQIGNKGEKFTLTRNMKDDLNDILLEQGEEEQSEEIGQGNEEVDD